MFVRICFLLLSVFVFCSELAPQGHRVSDFKIKTETAAIKIAKAALEQEFGSPEISKLHYFEAVLKGDHWEVLGHPYERRAIPTHGGTFNVSIAVKGGCILRITLAM